MAQELFGRVVKFFEHFGRFARGWSATGAYNDALKSYERMGLPSEERLMKLGGGTAAKQLPQIPQVEMALRLP